VILQIIFWILLLLAALGAFIQDAAYPWLVRSRWVVVLILIAILGYRFFGSPLDK
jgi:hypothetical protein